MNSLLTNLIHPKFQSWPEFARLKFMFKNSYLFQYLMDLTNEGSKFKLDCVKSKNSYILLIDVINFKLCLINCIYIFLRYPVGSNFSDSQKMHCLCILSRQW